MSEPEPSILIVDDNPTNVTVLLEYLSDSGFKVLVAEDGQSALEQVAYLKPDLILLDVMMPGVDGFETCRRLKEKEETRDIPVIFMTSLADTLDKVKGFNIGAVDYITKPIQYEEMLARVTTHLTLRNLQRQLQAQNLRLQEEIAERQKLIQELDAFAYTVAHDLQNPLSIIIAYTELLQASWSSEAERQEAVQVIAENGTRMTNIIKELLLLARMRQTEVMTQPLDMSKIAHEAQQRLIFMIEEKQAEIIIPDSWPVALGHAPWIEEVWANYLGNALKYGGQPPRLELGATPQTDGRVRFWVKDNGNGLSAADQARVFTPFTRLTQERVEGYGLGLSIAQRIVEKLGGQVGVESENLPGRGCTFYFTLP
ncbi:MAG: hybrid sensor histidine kinase/response regulator, partial [Myxococcales bacterium]|nr:hybrid sensor histidine kinase/response regulator [Myxococcales bacterium]